MDDAWKTCLELAAEGKSKEPTAAALKKASVLQKEFRRKQKAIDDARVLPDTSHERLEQVAMCASRQKLKPLRVHARTPPRLAGTASGSRSGTSRETAASSSLCPSWSTWCQ